MVFSYRRAMLHHEVWDERLAVVAAKYGLSEHQLREACKTFGVTLPGAKYWQRRNEGHAPNAGKLSRFVNRTTLDLGLEDAADVQFWDWDLADPMFRDTFNVPPIYVVPPGIVAESRWSKVYENADLAGWAAMDGSTPYDLYCNQPRGEISETIIHVNVGNTEFVAWLRIKHIGLSDPSSGRLLLGDLRYRCAEREITSSTLRDRYRFVNAFAAVLGANDIECEIRMATGCLATGTGPLSGGVHVHAVTDRTD
jgi:hypothetical protein